MVFIRWVLCPLPPPPYASYSSNEYYVGFDFKSRLDGHKCYCLTAMSSGNIISTQAYQWCENVVCYSYNEVRLDSRSLFEFGPF